MASRPVFNKQRGTWWVQWFDGKTTKRETVTKKVPGWKPGKTPPVKPPPEALAAYTRLAEKERKAKLQLGVSVDMTVREFLESYSETYIGREPGSKVALDQVIAVFLDWCEARGLKKLNQIRRAECIDWMDHRATTVAVRSKRPISHATLKKERALLAGAWSSAVKRERLDVNPWAKTEVPTKPEAKRRGSWTPAQFEKLLAKSHPWLKFLLTVGVNSGLRIEALLGLRWSDVKFDKGRYGEIQVRPELDKTHRGYSVPMTEKLHDLLSSHHGRASSDVNHVIIGSHGKPLKRSGSSLRAITDACRRAGLEKPDSPNHHMRRTFGRWAVMGHLVGRPVPVYVVSKWLGHSSVAMTEKYLQLNEEDNERWIEQVSPDQPSLQADLGQEPVER